MKETQCDLPVRALRATAPRNCAARWDPGAKRLNFFSGKHRRVYGGGRKAHTNCRGIPLSVNATL